MEQEFQATPGDGSGSIASQGTTAVDRGADLLVRVLESEEPVALTELASAAGIPKSTASRLISALERRGLIAQDGERGPLRPGPAILRVAERGMLERNIVELARPSLDALSDLTGETINLAVPGPLGVEHVAQVDSRHFIGAGHWLGRAVDYGQSANGKVFLAFGRAPDQASPVNLDAESIRVQGFATTVDELEPGLAAIAAPIRGARGDVIAALSISGPTLRMTPERIAELQPSLVEEALGVSRRLGYSQQGERAA